MVEYATKKLKANVGKSKVMRGLRYVNVGRMHARLKSEPLGLYEALGFAIGSGWRM